MTWESTLSEHEIVLLLSDEEYRLAGEQINVLRRRGAESNTKAILDALAVAANLPSSASEERKPKA